MYLRCKAERTSNGLSTQQVVDLRSQPWRPIRRATSVSLPTTRPTTVSSSLLMRRIESSGPYNLPRATHSGTYDNKSPGAEFLRVWADDDSQYRANGAPGPVPPSDWGAACVANRSLPAHGGCNAPALGVQAGRNELDPTVSPGKSLPDQPCGYPKTRCM